MKPIVLSLLLILSIAHMANCQRDAQLKVFTNYGTCQHGLKDRDGTVVRPAEFDELHYRWHGRYDSRSRIHFWVAKKNGSFGLLTPLGKELIPFRYEHFQIYPEVIVANDNEASYLFTLEGKLIKRFEGFSWVAPSGLGYFFKQNDKYGFLDISFDEVLPPIYDQIQAPTIRHRQEGYKGVISNRFLKLTKGEKSGIFSIEQKKLIAPFTSEHVWLNWVKSDCENSDLLIHISYHDVDRIEIINSSGVKMLSTTHSPSVRYGLTPLDSCGTTSIQLAYIEKDRKMKVLNLKTGKYSNEHDEIYHEKGYSIYFDDPQSSL